MKLEDVYQETAKKDSATVEKVKQEEAWSDPHRNDIIRASQNKVPCHGATPTPDEFIRYVAGKVEVEMYE